MAKEKNIAFKAASPKANLYTILIKKSNGKLKKVDLSIGSEN